LSSAEQMRPHADGHCLTIFSIALSYLAKAAKFRMSSMMQAHLKTRQDDSHAWKFDPPVNLMRIRLSVLQRSFRVTTSSKMSTASLPVFRGFRMTASENVEDG